jgi:RND family efflux transporter MFP subunit
MKTTKKTLALLAAAASIVSLAACGGSHKTPPKAEALAPISASLATAQLRETPKRMELYGTVEAGKSAVVSSRVMASVIAVRVKAGDTVALGQLLVEIDPQTAKGQESQARGALAQAKAGLSLAEKNYERFKALAKTGAASDLELDMARMQYEQAVGAVEQGDGAVSAASSVSKESRVVAPFAGRVSATMVEPGDLAAPGRPLVMVESTAGRRLVLSVPESLVVASGITIGKPVDMSIDSKAAMGSIKGTVIEMSPGADPASHTFTVKVEFPGANVPTGVSGRAFLETGTRKAILVPANAVLNQGGLSLVVIKDEAGKARSRAVTTGQASGDGSIEILSGLQGNETVLTMLAAIPPDGSPVTSASEVTK